MKCYLLEIITVRLKMIAILLNLFRYGSISITHSLLRLIYQLIISRDNFVYTISRDNQGKRIIYIYALPISLWSVYTICVMVKDKRMIILYAIISSDQPLFKLYFSVREIYKDFTLRFTLSLSIPFTSLSYLSLPLLSLLLPFFLSLSLLLSVILFGVSNGRFRPCFFFYQ